MSIIRVRKDARYFVASNEPFVDEKLSWEARGLMGYLLTKPDHWEVRTHDLTKKGPAGEHKIRRMLAELRKSGYMNRIRIVNTDKTFDWITEVFESPSQNPHPNASGRFSTSGSSTSGKVPDIVIPDLPITELAKDQLHGAEPAPTEFPLPLEWQIASGQEIKLPTEDQQLQADMHFACMGICRGMPAIESLVMSFLQTRKIIPTKSQYKGWQKAFRAMYDAKPNRVSPDHLAQAITELEAWKPGSVVDPFSPMNKAISIANPSGIKPQEKKENVTQEEFREGLTEWIEKRSQEAANV